MQSKMQQQDKPKQTQQPQQTKKVDKEALKASKEAKKKTITNNEIVRKLLNPGTKIIPHDPLVAQANKK